MFYEVKVLDEQGKVMKVISSKRLSNKFWKNNNQGKEFTGNMGVDEDEFDYYSSWNTMGGSRSSKIKYDESA